MQSKQVTAKVLDRVYVHIASCISGSSTVADAGSIWPRGPGEDGTGHSNSMLQTRLQSEVQNRCVKNNEVGPAD